jgi:hypothetical protein
MLLGYDQNVNNYFLPPDAYKKELTKNFLKAIIASIAVVMR